MQRKKQNIDLLIFDLDGTLADTCRDLADAVNHALKNLGRKALDAQTITGFIGDGISKLMERALQNPGKQELEKALYLFHRYYDEHLADSTGLYPGMQESLDHFSDKKMAILTNKMQKYADAIVEKLSLARFFALTVGGQPRFQKKPDPESILYILEKLQVSPERAVLIGDSKNDILAGKAAGILTCAAFYGYNPPDELQTLNPDFAIHSPQELNSLFL